MQNKKIRFATMALAMAMPILATASGQIEGIAVQKYRKGVEVQIEGKGLIEPTGSFLNSNTLYTLEFDAKLAPKPEKMQIWQNGLQTIQTTQIANSTRVRIQFRFQSGMKAEVTKTESGFSINFDPIDITESGLGSFVKKLEPKKETLPSAAQPFFLDGHVPVKTPVKKAETKATEKKVAPAVEPAPKPEKIVQDGRVSLDFVDTNVVFILKSLAKQTGSNIVTSPDVAGKLTVKLDNVTVKEALTLVTSLTGLRFAQVGRTYVVTTNGKFLETLKSVQGSREESTLSRVVPIFSGQGNQIKVAVLKSVSSETAYGRFELVLPSEKAVVASNQKVSKDGTKDGEDKDGTQVSMMSNVDAKDTYMMVIGNPARLDEIEQLIRGIDRQLCNAIGVRVPENNTPVIETYSVHGGRAIDLVEAVAGKGKTAVGSVELFATPTNSIAKQTIVLKGREDEVRNVLRALEQLDSDEALMQKEFRTIDLQFTDPRAMRELIISQVPGVSCVIAPNGVMNPTAYMQEQLRMQSEQRGTDQPAPQGGGTAMASGNQNAMMMGGQGMGGQGMGAGGAAGGMGGQGGVTKDSADTGIILPFQGLEPTAFPMKLILRGSPEQVAAALDLVNKTDVAPRQVSLEMRVMEISREELLRLGINWNLFTSGAIKTISLNNSATNPSNKIGASVQGRDVSGDVGATLDSISNGNRLVSRPNLICTDGRGNEIFVGDAIRYIESIQSTQNGVSVSSGTVRAGVRLAAFPRLGGDGAINLDIRTAVTYLKGFKQVPQIGGELPQTSERVGQNTITLRDGETFAIGGLIQEQDRKELSGLPILKDLPFFGQFFRRTSTDKVKTELVIFVTAKSIKVNQPTDTKSLPMAPDSDIIKNSENLKPAMKMPAMAASKTQSKTETKKKGGKG